MPKRAPRSLLVELAPASLQGDFFAPPIFSRKPAGRFFRDAKIPLQAAGTPSHDVELLLQLAGTPSHEVKPFLQVAGAPSHEVKPFLQAAGQILPRKRYILQNCRTYFLNNSRSKTKKKMEKNLLRIPLHNLKNNTHLELLKEMLSVLLQINVPVPAKLLAKIDELSKLVAEEDAVLVLVHKYETTEDIAALDTERDSLYRGMTDVQRSARRDFDPVVKAAAKRLQPVFDAAGNVVRLPYEDETTALDKLLLELDARPADVATVGLTRWTNELRRINDALRALFAARFSEEAQRSHVKLQNVRRQVDATNLDIIRLREAAATLDDSNTYSALFAELNARISHHKNLLAQAKGRRKAGGAEAGAEGSLEGASSAE
jgi:hypothetical protein